MMSLAFSSLSTGAGKRKTAWMLAGAAVCMFAGAFASVYPSLPRALGNMHARPPQTALRKPMVPAKPLIEGPTSGNAPKQTLMTVEELLSQPGLVGRIMKNRESESAKLNTDREKFTYWLAAARICSSHMDIDSQRKLVFIAAKNMRDLLYEREDGALSRMGYYAGNAGKPPVARVDGVDVTFAGHSIAWHALCMARGVLLVADEIGSNYRDAVEIVWQLAGAGAGIGSYIRYAAEPMAEAMRKTSDPIILRMAVEFFINLGQRGRARCLKLKDLELVAGILDQGIHETADDSSSFGKRKLAALMNAELIIGRAHERMLRELKRQEEDESERLREAPAIPKHPESQRALDV